MLAVRWLPKHLSSPSSLSATATATATATAPTTIHFTGDFLWLTTTVEPYVDKYLQSVNTNAPGEANLGNASTVGEFSLDSNRLWVPSNNTFLYTNVQPPANSSVTRLPIIFDPTPNGFGWFEVNDPTLLRQDPSIMRLSPEAFYLCPDANGNNLLWIDLGQYNVSTPTGCHDVTINYSFSTTVGP
ncbi:hypothetical protein FRB95_007379 [Tulasnella sp. JGI-2019a]|nr:hypothetical protein FRB95_007379 [Tulasnella sp. JGI-2019a]